MTKTTPPPAPGYRLCPTCGTRVGAAASKCLVCGTDLSVTGPQTPVKAGQGTALGRRPISLLTVLGIVVLLGLLIGGGVLIAIAGGFLPKPNPGTATPTSTQTPVPTLTFTPTATDTPEPTATPLPPVDYKLQSGDTCIKIALNFNVSVNSIIGANGGVINVDCTNLVVGATIKVPQPTPTPSPLPTATLPQGVATQAPRVTHKVIQGETLAGIAKNFGLSLVDIMQVNGISDPALIRIGQVLVIPLEKVKTPGPTPTLTVPPPYPAPQPLNPRDGESFQGVDSVSLQWATVTQLRPGEAYQVTIEDVTANTARRLQDVVADNKYIIPAAFQPEDARPHIYRWSVTTVRQRADSGANQPAVYDSAGVSSPERSFVWTGTRAGAAPTTTTP